MEPPHVETGLCGIENKSRNQKWNLPTLEAGLCGIITVFHIVTYYWAGRVLKHLKYPKTSTPPLHSSARSTNM